MIKMSKRIVTLPLDPTMVYLRRVSTIVYNRKVIRTIMIVQIIRQPLMKNGFPAFRRQLKGEIGIELEVTR